MAELHRKLDSLTIQGVIVDTLDHLVELLSPGRAEGIETLLGEKLQSADLAHMPPMRSVGSPYDVPVVVGEDLPGDGSGPACEHLVLDLDELLGGVRG